MRQSAIVIGGRPPHRLLVVLIVLAAALASSLAFQSADASAYSVDAYRNSTAITLPGNGNASTYPSTINVPPTAGHVIGVTVTFHGFSHGSAQSVNALLVAPDGSASLVMTNSCTTTVPLSTFIFTDRAPTAMPKFGPCDRADYRPTENTPDGWVDFGPGAPYGPYSANFSNFLRGPAGGTWKLFIKGYGGAKSGSIAGGWSLTLETSQVDALVPAMDPSGGSGHATPYPMLRPVAGRDGVITDVNVRTVGAYHSNAADLQMLLISPRGDGVVLMSDACRGNALGEDWVFDDESSSFMNIEEPCSTGTYRPVGRIDQPFPEGPLFPTGKETALSDFDLTDPNGNWRLYVTDDQPFDDNDGLFLDRYRLDIQTRPEADIQFASPALEVDEGGSGDVTLERSAGGQPLGRGTVIVTRAPGTAGPDDYQPGGTAVTFEKGETKKTFKVEALADGVADPDETFKLELGTTTGDAKRDGITEATVTIREPAASGGGGPTGGGQDPDPGPDVAAPVITGPTVTPKRFRVSPRGTATVARTGRGSRIRYSLSEAATVTLRFQRAVTTRRGGRRRWVAAGTLRRAGIAGVNRVPFSGRIGRRALRAGRYRLILRATDAAGNSAKAKPRALRVVR
jgi:subtilisin-like proprotein convertase family protein